MTPRRWWIVDAVEHRRLAYQQPIPETVRIGGVEVPVIPGPRPDLDEWVCDYCNNDIPILIELEGGRAMPMLVPMMGTSALCPSCCAQELADAGLPAKPEAWSDHFCACEACAAALAADMRYLGWMS